MHLRILNHNLFPFSGVWDYAPYHFAAQHVNESGLAPNVHLEMLTHNVFSPRPLPALALTPQNTRDQPNGGGGKRVGGRQGRKLNEPISCLLFFQRVLYAPYKFAGLIRHESGFAPDMHLGILSHNLFPFSGFWDYVPYHFAAQHVNESGLAPNVNLQMLTYNVLTNSSEEDLVTVCVYVSFNFFPLDPLPACLSRDFYNEK